MPVSLLPIVLQQFQLHSPSGACAAAAALSKKMITFSKSLLCVARYYKKEVKNLSLNLTA